MEGPLTFLQVNISYMVLLTLIVALLEYLLENVSWSTTVKDKKEEEIGVQQLVIAETPIFSRHLDSRHRYKLMTGARRKLDFSKY